MKLWLVRHAEVLAPAGLCYGRSDVAADARATQRAAGQLARALPRGVPMAHSPLSRCQSLAQAIAAQRADLAPRADARLAEMDFGAWEGRPWSDIARAEFDHWMAHFADAAPGGGECVRAFMARVGAAWDDWRATGTDAIWITHAGVMRAALLLARGMRAVGDARDWPRDELPFGSARVLEVG